MWIDREGGGVLVRFFSLGKGVGRASEKEWVLTVPTYWVGGVCR